jgi:NAD(P)-dependent dehydrogenase (short-subunit alcohol dehydrogenase family)
MIVSDYRDKVVAVVGAGHGIGRELVRQLAEQGAKFALASRPTGPLPELERELKDQGVEVVTALLDVRDPDALEAFAAQTFDHYGAVDYCFHNAGIAAVGNSWKMPLADWRWLMDVNLMGPVHGIRAFVPRLIAQDRECHFIITASAAGFVTAWGGAAYAASKHALIGLAESLELDLQKANAKVVSHVICPAYVLSNLHNSLDYRRADEWDPADPAYQDPDYLEAMERSARSTSGTGMPTDEAVRAMLEKLAAGDFVIMTHPQYGPVIEQRYGRLVSGRRPGAA